MLRNDYALCLKDYIEAHKFTSYAALHRAFRNTYPYIEISSVAFFNRCRQWGITSEPTRQAALHRRYIEEAPSLLENCQPARIAPGFQVFGIVEPFEKKFITKGGNEYREHMFSFKKGPHYSQKDGRWTAHEAVPATGEGLMAKSGALKFIQYEVDHQEPDGVLHPHYIDSSPSHGFIIAVSDTFSGYTLGGVFRESDPLIIIELLGQLRQALMTPLHYFTTNLGWDEIGPQWWYFRDNDISCRLTTKKTFRNEFGAFMRTLNRVMKNEFKRCGPTMLSADSRLHELRLKIEEEFNSRPATRKGSYHVVRSEMCLASPPSEADFSDLLTMKTQFSQRQRVWKTRTEYVCENHNIPRRSRFLYTTFAIWPDQYFQHPGVRRYKYEGLMSITHIPEGKSLRSERRRLAFMAWEIHDIHFKRLDTLQNAREKLPVELEIGMYRAPVSSWTEVFARVLRYSVVEIPSEALQSWMRASLPADALRLMGMSEDEVQVVPDDAGLELSYLQQWLDYQDAVGLERGKGDYYWAFFNEMSGITHWQNEFHQVLFSQLGETKLVELLWDLVNLTELASKCRLTLVKVPKRQQQPRRWRLTSQDRDHLEALMRDHYPDEDIDSLSDEELGELAGYTLSDLDLDDD